MEDLVTRKKTTMNSFCVPKDQLKVQNSRRKKENFDFIHSFVFSTRKKLPAKSIVKMFLYINLVSKVNSVIPSISFEINKYLLTAILFNKSFENVNIRLLVVDETGLDCWRHIHEELTCLLFLI